MPENHTFLALALDPIHIGMGGYRLGEVDLSILREPGTNLPKIPGSSLEGAARAFTAMSTQTGAQPKYRRAKPTFNPTTGQIEPAPVASGPAPSCAGKGGSDGSEHCGEIDCPVCVTYGFSNGPQNRSFQGLAQFFDARIVFFPVHSLAGPVWITSAEILSEAGLKATFTTPKDDQVCVAPELGSSLQRGGVNLGWLYLAIAAKDLKITGGLPDPLGAILKRLVLVPDRLFSQIVNSNLEVRTSVSIDPATGAAEDGALFTYEAMPRSTVLRFEVACLDPHYFSFPAWKDNRISATPFPAAQTAAWIAGNVQKGLELMRLLGVGGMNTRGFGRLQVIEQEVRP